MNTENDGQKKRKKRNILNNVEKQQGEKEEEEEDIWRGWRRSGGGVEAEFKGGIEAEKVSSNLHMWAISFIRSLFHRLALSSKGELQPPQVCFILHKLSFSKDELYPPKVSSNLHRTGGLYPSLSSLFHRLALSSKGEL
ncbi:hypothetical protein RRG08_062364 [Elysia crispata]|uniref:Uncharacterized protein n=1 Tax=Elysia crispata TaxID=231223 RepID=A0AAE0YG84_9GAST|nr:hypothetical protein RRG08_062364 [Elysia crispata]